MGLLVRRINRAKWNQNNIEDKDDVQADAITGCLRTSTNDLSVWKIKDEAGLNDAILALITGKRQEKLSTLHYILIDESIISEKGLILNKTNGDTAVSELVETHLDISELTYKKLGIVKSIVLDSIKSKQSSSFSRKQLKELITEAISGGRLKKESLNENLVKKEKL